jgi:hypothetical protein
MASQRSGERGRGGGFRRQDGSSGVLQKLQMNPVFQKSRMADPSSFESVRPRIPLQLLAYDGRGHLFVWNSQEKLLHFVDVQHSDSSRSGNTSNSASLLSKKDFKSVKMNPDVEFSVRHMVFNRTGRTLAIVGDSGLVVLDVVPHLSASSENPTSCRYASVPAQIIVLDGLQWNVLLLMSTLRMVISSCLLLLGHIGLLLIPVENCNQAPDLLEEGSWSCRSLFFNH